MAIRKKLRKFGQKMGYDVSRFHPTSHPLARIRKLYESYDIDVVLDVGANAGQFGQHLRTEIGFSGRIISFEPVGSAFEHLKKHAARDELWDIFQYALGESESRGEIHIAANSYSSSILDMLPAHLRNAPESKYIGSEIIEIRTLDSLIGQLCAPDDEILLKIDTQGYESKVLQGSMKSLQRISTIQLEMALVPLYRNEVLFADMHGLLVEQGYNLVSLGPAFVDQDTGEVLQLDGIYHRPQGVNTER